MSLLEVSNLSAVVAGNEVLKSFELKVNAGELHFIMGPNGAGKSSLAHVIGGKPGYDITGGEITLGGEDLVSREADERSRMGVFIAMQYPVELPGISCLNFLKTVVNIHRKEKGLEELDGVELLQLVQAKSKELGISNELLKREYNVGFSGGEKKRMEALQMSLLEPKIAILDEIDSGVDIDALAAICRLISGVVSQGTAVIAITHYHMLLERLQPDFVHIMAKGKIVASGSMELAQRVKEGGYRDIAAQN